MKSRNGRMPKGIGDGMGRVYHRDQTTPVPKRTNAERHWRRRGAVAASRAAWAGPETDECRKALETGRPRLWWPPLGRVPKRTNAERHWRLAASSASRQAPVTGSRNGRMPKGIGDTCQSDERAYHEDVSRNGRMPKGIGDPVVPSTPQWASASPETDECRKALETRYLSRDDQPLLPVPKRTNAERHWRLAESQREPQSRLPVPKRTNAERHWRRGRLSGGLVSEGGVPKRTNAERHWRHLGGGSGEGRLGGSRNGRMPKGIGDFLTRGLLLAVCGSPETDECRKALETGEAGGGFALCVWSRNGRMPKGIGDPRCRLSAPAATRASRNGRMPKGIGDAHERGADQVGQITVPKRTNAERHWRLSVVLVGSIILARVPKRTNAERHWRPADPSATRRISEIVPKRTNAERHWRLSAALTRSGRLRRVPKRTNAERHWRLSCRRRPP